MYSCVRRIGHPGDQSRQHQSAYHLAAFQSYSTPYVHLQAAGGNVVAATSRAGPAAFYGPNTNVPPPPPLATANNHHLAAHGQHPMRTVLLTHPQRQHQG